MILQICSIKLFDKCIFIKYFIAFSIILNVSSINFCGITDVTTQKKGEEQAFLVFKFFIYYIFS